ncbi:MAG: aldehyde dehydrogenase family protein [Gammaproteobacteria bacterium]|nr:aldehyde dehydrogenase family protein [Gammaproteobacteria bacterium]
MVAATGNACFEVFSPATEEVIGHAATATVNDVDKAVTAARIGFARWQTMSPAQREAALLRAADIIAAQGEQRILQTLMQESGSTISKARGEIAYSVDLLRTAAGEARRLYGDTFPNDRNDRVSMVFREAIGVVAVIAPYNAPLSLTVKMSAFPLAAGNSVVIKPSEETPLTAMTYASILKEAGIPDGTVNVVTGFPQDCGEPLVSHTDIDCVALTGSTATGVAVGSAAMQRMRRVQLELGGKSAVLVLRDADPREAARIAAEGMFAHAGQICMANSRMIVEAPVYDDFSAELKSCLESLPIGDQLDPACVYGPVISRNALAKIQQHQQDALERGATLLTGGKVRQGLVYEPTIVVEPPRDSTLWRDESFGPIASLVAAVDLDDAISIANDSDFGLSAAVLTSNVKWAFRAARQIRAGSVHIGMHSFQSNALAPIGGLGMSGLGKSGGHYSTLEFSELKWVSIELGGAQ